MGTNTMSKSPEIRVLAIAQEIFQAAAEHFVQQANDAISRSGRFAVALSGGSTPKGLYSLLASDFRSSVPWKQTFFFWGDERHVPPDHPDSNYGMANAAMLSRVPVPGENVFRVLAEQKDANVAATKYEQTLRNFFHLQPEEFPSFDLIHLGMGPDGHTASLFPGTAALKEKSRLVVANWVEKFKTHRITFTLPVLNNGKCVTFMVSGSDKAPALREVLEGDAPGDQFPSKLVRATKGRLIWLVDRAAAAGLSKVALSKNLERTG
jgi:6-phosphogluconolactonase